MYKIKPSKDERWLIMLDKEDLGLKLRDLRLCTGLSQNEVASRLEIGTTTISGYERGASLPLLETFYQLIDLYKGSADYALGLDSTKKLIINVSKLNKEQVAFLSSIIDLYIQLLLSN